MRRAAFVVLAACGGSSPQPRPAPAPAPAAITHDLVIEHPTWQGTMYFDGVIRALRDAITPLTPCAQALAPGDVLEVGFQVDDGGHVTAADVTPASVAECATAAARGIVFDAPLAPFPPVWIDGRWTVVAITGAPIPPALRCAADDECRLVSGGCGGPAPAQALHAQQLDARGRELAQVDDCPAPSVAGGAPACVDGACALAPVAPAAWNACRRDDDCTSVLLPDGAFRPIAAAHVADAVAAGASEVSAAVDPPSVVCRYGACFTGWASPP